MIFSIINFSFLFLLFIFLYFKKILSKNLLLIFFFLLLSPFFINNVLFDPGYMPDQAYYLDLHQKVRNLIFTFEPLPTVVRNRPLYAVIIQTVLTPLPFMFSVLDLALSQKFLFLITFLFLYKKNALNDYSFAVLLLLPSVVLYTGVALKESLIFCLVTMSFYFSLKRKYLFSILFYLILLLIKPTIFVLSLIFNVGYLILFYKNSISNKKIIFFILFILLILIIIFINIEWLNNFANHRIKVEAIYDGKITEFDIINEKVNLLNIFSLSSFILKGFINFYLNPNFMNSNNLFQFMQSIENIFLILLLIFNFFYCYEKDNLKSIFWLMFLFAGTIIIGGLVSNFGTMTRWKIEIIMYYIFYINLTCEKQKNLK